MEDWVKLNWINKIEAISIDERWLWGTTKVCCSHITAQGATYVYDAFSF